MTASLTLTVRLWIVPNQRKAFDAFEAVAFQRIAEHGGEILSVLTFESHSDGQPDEVHIIRFPSEAAFDAYRMDPVMAKQQGKREACIKRTEIERA